jgi:hypothetical protein
MSMAPNQLAVWHGARAPSRPVGRQGRDRPRGEVRRPVGWGSWPLPSRAFGAPGALFPGKVTYTAGAVGGDRFAGAYPGL